jgi:hypothetical protein
MLTKSLDSARATIYDNIKGIYAGLCIVTLVLLPSSSTSFPNSNPVVPGCNYSDPGISSIPVGAMWHPVGTENRLVSLPAMLDIYKQSSPLSYMLTYGPNHTALTIDDIRLYNYSLYSITAPQTDTFWFVGYYSNVSLPGNYVLQLVGTFCMV